MKVGLLWGVWEEKNSPIRGEGGGEGVEGQLVKHVMVHLRGGGGGGCMRVRVGVVA